MSEISVHKRFELLVTYPITRARSDTSGRILSISVLNKNSSDEVALKALSKHLIVTGLFRKHMNRYCVKEISIETARKILTIHGKKLPSLQSKP